MRSGFFFFFCSPHFQQNESYFGWGPAHSNSRFGGAVWKLRLSEVNNQNPLASRVSCVMFDAHKVLIRLRGAELRDAMATCDGLILTRVFAIDRYLLGGYQSRDAGAACRCEA